MGRRGRLALASVTVGLITLILGGTAGASGITQVRYTMTLNGSVRTTWSVPEQLLSSTCYHDQWERGQGTEQIGVHMGETRALAVVYNRKSASFTLGSWQLYHGHAFAREQVTRQGQTTTFDRPGNCGKGGDGPTINDGPGGCGNRVGTPQISLSDVGSSDRWQMYVSDTKAQIRPYTDCPVFYASTDGIGDAVSPILGRIRVKDLLNKHKRHITLHIEKHWHHGRGSAVTNYFIADTSAFWTLELTRER